MSATTMNPEVPAAPTRRSAGRYRRAFRSPDAITGLAILAVIVVSALVGPLLLPYGPNEQSANALAAPGADGHLLGTDEIGRDLLARLFAGTRVDVLITLIGVPIAAVIGTFLGLLGAVSAMAGSAFQRVFDVLLGIPAIILGIGVGIAIGPGQTSVTVAIILVATPLFGRQARSALLSQLPLDYVAAADVLGFSRWRTMVRHILPNIVDVIFVRFAMEMAHAITIEGSLSVIGLGIQAPQASLGGTIKDGSSYLFDRPLYALAPVAVVVAMVIGYILISNALNRAVLRS